MITIIRINEKYKIRWKKNVIRKKNHDNNSSNNNGSKNNNSDVDTNASGGAGGYNYTAPDSLFRVGVALDINHVVVVRMRMVIYARFWKESCGCEM